ncbi:hypothetical protein [Geoglobus acetivorans]|uniref:Uncharacterized protein n=1 Tax=Geoglobus acetivorans TaxID=565033 RepID=A0ABZ3H2F5_GEOAI|nr:hypothetical protein [Geoglobus acetivorans]
MYLYPKEIVADTYLSRLGGFSEEFARNEIGINEKAIEVNTSLIPDETKVKIRFLDEREKPYFLRPMFTVVSIPTGRRACEYSRDGEVVLSAEHAEVLGNRVGKFMVLNSVESFRIDGDYSSMEKAVKSMREWIWKSESLRKRN